MAGKNKGKSKVSKTSKVKLANKKQNKFGKQGKIKKLKSKQKKKLARKLRDAQAGDHSFRKAQEESREIEEHESPLEDQDVKFYSKSGLNTSFASSLSISNQTDGKPNKKKRKQEVTEDEASFEKIPRTLPTNRKMKMLLPTKEQRRIIPQMIEREAASEEEEEEAENDKQDDISNVNKDGAVSKPAKEALPAMSNVELFALRRRKLAERKEKIALCVFAVMENPQENMSKLRELYLMLLEEDPGISVTVQSWAMLSLADVFKDIIPAYKIRLPTDKEKQQRMAMETKSLHGFESALLLNYRKYLEYLELTARGEVKEFVSKKTKKNGQIKQNYLPKQLSVLAVKCLGQMLIGLPHFNYTNNIITVLVPFMNKQREVSDRVCEDIRRVFHQDKTGEVTLEIVRSIGRMIKARNFKIQPKVLDTFLSLKIKEIDLSSAEGKKDAAKRKEKLLMMSRKQRKHQKQLEKLEIELTEIRATEDKKKKLRLHTEVMNAVFVTYFRILKQARKSGLLPSVFEGLAKFAHLINIDFFDDLFTVFKNILESGELQYRQSLQCIQTAFTILSGQGAALNIDPMNFYRHLYQKLLKIHAGSDSKDILIILNCLDLMISKRKRQVSQPRILAFLKRLCTICLQHQPHAVLGILSAVRSLIHNHTSTDLLFDNEAQGSGVYLPELDDPEHCHAHNATLWEITTLRNHFHPVVRRFATHISKQCPSTGEGQLIPDLARMSTIALFQKYEKENEVFDCSIPDKTHKSHRKRLTSGVSSEEMEKYLKHVLEVVPDSLSDFSPHIS
ncbi:nucleolar complex protein 3 homolog [Gigantopelta aegis]|uniref:nucleolar complex protein 3 homolog n=1 Tax=Gigantopelta aegis TaxID=1735272 RepID=UPI001B88E0A5|nr:nucleolar complex protein 3 homolog [Gigantopelta aegis]